MKFSWEIVITKGMKYFVIFAVPFLLSNYPEYMNLTIGAVLVMLANIAKNKFNIKLP